MICLLFFFGQMCSLVTILKQPKVFYVWWAYPIKNIFIPFVTKTIFYNSFVQEEKNILPIITNDVNKIFRNATEIYFIDDVCSISLIILDQIVSF